MKTIITIEILESGQPRPYADSRCRARIKAVRYSFILKNMVAKKLKKDEVRQLTRMFVQDYEDKPKWFETRLESIIKKEEEKWEVTLITPSTN